MKPWHFLAAWALVAIVGGSLLGYLVARRREQLERDAQMHKQLTVTLVTLHNVCELLEALSLSLTTHPMVSMRRKESKQIADTLSKARLVLSTFAGPSPRIDYSHMPASHTRARWPYTGEGKVRP